MYHYMVCGPLRLSKVIKLLTILYGYVVQIFMNENLGSYLVNCEHKRGNSSHAGAKAKLQILQQEMRSVRNTVRLEEGRNYNDVLYYIYVSTSVTF
jgi:hypothetical protein